MFLTLAVYNVNNLIVTYFHRSCGIRVYVGFYSNLANYVEEVAVKVVPLDGNQAKAFAEREANILVKLNHINLAAYCVRLCILHF